MYMHIHPSRSQQRRIKLFFIISCKHDDPLLAACRPQPINEVQQSRKAYLIIMRLVAFILFILIPVLKINGTVNPVKPRVHSNLPEVQIIDIKFEVIRHGTNQGRFTRSRRPKKQVPTFPRLSDLFIVLFPLNKSR
ncbi:hypothetical protein IEQ34_003197 [Dendrobium chrysotoxum]|uniref:Uncharacterized protein n=1 Tax=Dendrobium chrysotoxum TaxID=161865 RepID=A0AAV7H2Z5_DENCH|nr:hypothetical protein IEQ34_003197 [Dendrobium chrysotoxum]